MRPWKTSPSTQDQSVNFIAVGDQGLWEARYVRRVEDYFIVYLSSHTGCTHACRFCHLTATKQTGFVPATVKDYEEQARMVLAHYDTVKEQQGAAKRVNFNWMARGEALSNPELLTNAKDVFAMLNAMANARDLKPAFNVSTIMPKDFAPYQLESVFQDLPATLYYSLYSLNEKFRKRWLPKALPALEALDRLKEWQTHSGQDVVLHWAFIAGENDAESDMHDICDEIEQRALKVRFNVVRYNPFDARRGQESAPEILRRNFEILAERMSLPGSRIVPRVGFDVKASCGMFVQDALE